MECVAQDTVLILHETIYSFLQSSWCTLFCNNSLHIQLAVNFRNLTGNVQGAAHQFPYKADKLRQVWLFKSKLLLYLLLKMVAFSKKSISMTATRLKWAISQTFKLDFVIGVSFWPNKLQLIKFHLELWIFVLRHNHVPKICFLLCCLAANSDLRTKQITKVSFSFTCQNEENED